jgi:DNA-directed RNA polymerase subunit omega
MRDDYLKAALKKIDDPNILINVVSTRVKQLRRGSRALVESLEKLSPEDLALREIIEGRITYDIPTAEKPVEQRQSSDVVPMLVGRL